MIVLSRNVNQFLKLNSDISKLSLIFRANVPIKPMILSDAERTLFHFVQSIRQLMEKHEFCYFPRYSPCETPYSQSMVHALKHEG